ncbi:chitin synthesis regulation, resistance to congo red-domain-containing protein [Cercophora scortea]|uniref:Chitin synthesis regulation, resistance to congo red-domain-containing protein n=1 Tax=Cercophora scortea TaxID=314031 RepID=A0AAE0MM49_9PEZI|nr:chitin synthesis regulation, resistance to congo red-domain-containing protein [Cercophora scortea]
MAPHTLATLAHETAGIVKRDNCYYSNGYRYCYSSWYWWGRWVFAAALIVIFLAVLFALGRRNSRRRREQGVAPRYGTGWLAPAPPYYPNPPPPQYSAQPMNPQNTGYKFNQNDGYYANQQEGIQLQQPQSSYQPQNRGVDEVYAPPEGPPPPKRT